MGVPRSTLGEMSLFPIPTMEEAIALVIIFAVVCFIGAIVGGKKF